MRHISKKISIKCLHTTISCYILLYIAKTCKGVDMKTAIANYITRVKDSKGLCGGCQVDGHVECGREYWTHRLTETITCECCVETDSFSRETENYWKEIQRAICHQIVEGIDSLAVGFDTKTQNWVVVRRGA